jgi:hypothetical protein
MNKLFPAAQAIKFVVGCHAKCSSLELKLQENSLVPELEFSCPAKSENQRRRQFEPQNGSRSESHFSIKIQKKGKNNCQHQPRR